MVAFTSRRCLWPCVAYKRRGLRQYKGGNMKPTNFRGRPLLHIMVFIFVLAAIFLPRGESSAALINGLYNTGVGADGQKLEDGELDKHYILTERPAGVLPGTFAFSDATPGLWTPALGQSAWVGPKNGNKNVAEGIYTYSLTFNLGGLIPSTAKISGQWATDNASQLFLNGDDTGNFIRVPGFLSLSDFAIDSNYFIAGLNTLEFRVNNLPSADENPSGLLVLNLAGTAHAVPIPGAVWLLGCGLIGLVGVKTKSSG